jgi:hypothetical protein
MQNDLTAHDGPRSANAAPIGSGRPRRRRAVRSGLLALPLALALITPGATALAAEATTGYSQTTPPPPPKTETTPAPKTEPTPTPGTSTTPTTETGTTSSPKGGVSPTQTSSTPASSTQPAKSGNEPTATTAHATTLPFTGLDLRWVILGGVLLMGMGLSIIVVQRGRHRTNR